MSESDWVELKTVGGDELVVRLCDIQSIKDIWPLQNSTRVHFGVDTVGVYVSKPPYSEIKRRVEEFERRKSQPPQVVDAPTLLDGDNKVWRLVDYRIPRRGELYIAHPSEIVNGKPLIVVCDTMSSSTADRPIVERVEAESKPIWEDAKAGEFFEAAKSIGSRLYHLNTIQTAENAPTLWQLSNVKDGATWCGVFQTIREAFGAYQHFGFRRVPRSEMARIMQSWGD